MLAAKDLFLQFGYEGSSMDAIALAAGVSKLTVYNHFQDKENLFVAAVENHCDHQLPALDFDLKADMAIEAALLKIATRFQSIIYSREGLELHRLMCSMTQQNPGLVHNFYQAGAARVLSHMTRLLEQAHAQHKLSINNYQQAAEYFLSLLCGHRHMRVMFGIEVAPDSAQQQQLAQDAIGLFVKAYAA
ncbi:TetR/AcrR family transcriptional regulator [Alkanindiges sp. WGS2144]|uniref:TetR/AcrR family transcriptional regulator n=1 Tax=Alkanindiges sp. WGS2144 TaxID=3366808 RepID=UPI00375356ED